MTETEEFGENGVSSETSKRVCRHMNEDHSVSVFAMARAVTTIPRGFVITQATLTKVTLGGCTIRIVMCRKDDMCRMETVEYPFRPPLSSARELRPRLVAIHHKVCAPNLAWLVTKPLSQLILVTCSAMGYGTIAIGRDELANVIERTTICNSLLSTVFGSAFVFCFLVELGFWFAVVTHGAEAVYVAHQSRRSLKLSRASATLWFIGVFLVGYPILTEFTALLRVSNSSKTALLKGD